MSLQWRVFRLANYLLITCVLAFTGLLVYAFYREGQMTAEVAFFYFLALASAVILLTNYCSNLYLLERCYPHGEISGSYRWLIGIILFLTSMIIAFLTLTFAYLVHDVINENIQSDMYTTRTHIITAVFGMILLIIYYVTWQQVALRKTIQRNRRRLYNAFLESDQ